NGEVDEAIRLGEQAVARARGLDDWWLLAFSLFMLALVATNGPEPQRTDALYAECLDVCDTAGDALYSTLTLSHVGMTELWRGDLEVARAHLTTAVANG